MTCEREIPTPLTDEQLARSGYYRDERGTVRPITYKDRSRRERTSPTTPDAPTAEQRAERLGHQLNQLAYGAYASGKYRMVDLGVLEDLTAQAWALHYALAPALYDTDDGQ